MRSEKPVNLKGLEITAQCVSCLQDFIYRKGSGPLRKFCSPTCLKAGRPRPSRSPRTTPEYVNLRGQELTIECIICWTPFSYLKGAGRLRRFCSAACKKAGLARIVVGKRVGLVDYQCKECGKEYSRRPKANNKGFCSISCNMRHHANLRRIHVDKKTAHRVHSQRRRARLRGATVEKFHAIEIYERDGWICGICTDPVDKKCQFPDKMSPTLDHIVALARGGAHSRENTRCAHWICNSRKTFMCDPVAVAA